MEKQIEAFLLEVKDWVLAQVICARFTLTERALRAHNGKPGVLDNFAVSSDKGYKHISLFTQEEFLERCHTIRRHGIGELRKTRLWKKVRARIQKPATPYRLDPTGQTLLPV